MANYIAYITPEKDTLVIDSKRLFGTACTAMTLSFDSGVSVEYREKNVFINSVPLSKCNGYTFNNSVDPYIYTIRINRTSDYKEMSFTASFSGGTIRVYVTDSDVQEIPDTELDAVQLSTKLQSFMLVRTNPKLTGNIK